MASVLTETYAVRVEKSIGQGLDAAARAVGLSTAEAHRLAIEMFIATIVQTLEDGSAPEAGGHTV